MKKRKGKDGRMRLGVGIFLLLAMAAAMSPGCAGWTLQKTDIKCPKCGATFSVEEGMRWQDIKR